ncbi:MAG: TetR family transcriptional regulator, partial [Microbacteriaceae bacterium]|nr:TetR family transcriptional regulator [Microbacteriaceae bacterium]
MLQEAALELFVEQTYAKTTIEEITQRAGVSRATFFNYFPAKSDVFWVDLDDALRRLSGVLGDHQSVEKTPTVGLLVVLQGLCAVAREMGEGR